MIGQKKIQEKLNNIPQSILIVGEKGMGKKCIVEKICEKKHILHSFEASGELSKDFIDELYITNMPTLVLFDLVSLANGKRIELIENALLKLLEEPPAHVTIVILAESKSGILDTIINRCQIWEMEPYSADELKQLSTKLVGVSDEVLEQVIKTPYNMLNLDPNELNATADLATKIITKITQANISNLLSIPNKVDFGDDDSKIDLYLLIDYISYLFMRYSIDFGDNKFVNGLKLTHELKNNLSILGINKRHLFEGYLLDLRKVLLYE